MATVVYIPTYDTDSTFYMSKTKIGIDHFSADADEYSISGVTTLTDMLNSQYTLQQLNEVSPSQADYDTADRMAQELVESVTQLADTLKKTTADYVNTTENGYIVITENTGISTRSIIICGGLIFIFMLINYVRIAMDTLSRRAQRERVKKDM